LIKIQEVHPNKIVEVWFQDETRVGQQGRLTRVWGARGERQRIVKDMRFEYSYIYGAICPERDIGEAIVINSVGKESMQHHLDAVSKRIPEDRHGVVVMDRAPWHIHLKPPANITIVHLPSYSPELNPHENVWEYLKNNYLSNTVYDNLDHVTKACCEAWNAFCNEPGRISSIGTRQWVQLTNAF
jgi:transposase